MTSARRALTGVLLGVALPGLAATQLPAIGAAALLHPWRQSVDAPRPAGCADVVFAGGAGALQGWRCGAAGPARATVIFLHGVAANRASGAGVLTRFAARGFDAIAYDSRAHGESDGEACTYGYFEQDDLRRVIDALPPAPIVLIGTSLGAAVALQHAATDPRVRAVVAAEAFADLRTVASERAPFVFTAGLIERAFRRAEHRGRFVVDKVSPAMAARSVRAPTLLIHGEADSRTPASHAHRIHAALPGPKRLILVPGAGHNESLRGAVWAEVDRWIDVALGRADGELVARQAQLEFHSALWPNLHHVLWAEAWARRPASAESPSPAGDLPERMTAALTGAERTAWEAAVAYYDREIADLHPLFDAESAAIRRALIAARPEAPAVEGLPPRHRQVLTAAAAVYRRHLWPAHDRANRAWIDAVVPHIAALSPEVPDRLATLYGTPWFAAPLRVDVVRVAAREGAFTSRDPAPGHVTLASSHPASQNWTAAEVVFHEASHLLFIPLMGQFGKELEAQGKMTRQGPMESWNVNVWHVTLFYSTGEVVRRALEARGIAYEPYANRTGLFARAWPHLIGPVEAHWKAYLHGETTREEAIRHIVAALK